MSCTCNGCILCLQCLPMPGGFMEENKEIMRDLEKLGALDNLQAINEELYNTLHALVNVPFGRAYRPVLDQAREVLLKYKAMPKGRHDTPITSS